MGKTLFLLLGIIAVITCPAQQKDIDSFASALQKHPQLDTTHVMLLCKLAQSYPGVNPDKGIALSNEGISLANKLNSPKLLAAAYAAKAANYINQGLFDSAEYLYRRTLPIYENLNNRDGIARVYVNLGVICFYKSDYAGYLVNENKALEIFEDEHNSVSMASCYANIAIAYEAFSDYTRALDYHLKCLRVYENLHDSVALARSYGNLIEVYRGLGNLPLALLYAKKAIYIGEKIGNHLIVTTAYAGAGQIYFYMGDPAIAVEYYLYALQQANKYGFSNPKPVFMQMAGNAYLGLKKYAEAFGYCENSISLLAALGDKENLSISYDLLGEIYLASPEWLLNKKGVPSAGRIATALKYLDSSLSIARQVGAKEKAQAALTDISGAYAEAGNYAKALEAFKQSIIYKDSIINDDKKKQVTRLEMQYGFDRQEDSLKAENNKRQALAVAEIRLQQTIRNAAILGAFIILASGVIVILLYKKRKDADSLRQEAEFKAHAAETEMKTLRAQMNPHFIFNSLNSIADYIDKHETETASEFTVKFARLMRMVLENSEQKEVLLADDLAALELYMELERARLQNKFSYEIKVDDDIDKENTLIPPLLMQPFVENSIWHGVGKKQGPGKIVVFVQKEGEMIHCIVEDDGPGITPENTENGEKKHFGMKITRARVDIMNTLEKMNATVTVLNKQPGVRAEIKLPLKLKY